MNDFALGERHSLRRYIAFGIVAGVLAGTLTVVFGVSLLLAAGVGAAFVGMVADLSHHFEPIFSDDSGIRPIFVVIPIVLLVIGFAVFGGRHVGAGSAMPDSAMWVLLALGVLCFGALIVLNR